MSQTRSCIFCGIVRGEAPCFRVYEDEFALAFMDHFPVTDGHTLVIAREHSENIFEIGEASIAGVAAASKKVALAIRKVLGPEGLAVYQANGPAAGQTVFHYHTHLIPRSSGTRLTFHGRDRGDPERLRSTAEALAAAIGGPGGSRPPR